MGNHTSHNSLNHLSSGDEKSQGSGTNTREGSRKGMSRTPSAADIHDNKVSMLPIEKLGKILVHKSREEDGIDGVTQKSFTKYLFPAYPDLAQRFFDYVHHESKSKQSYINLSSFKIICERIMSVLDDALIIEIYVKMFGDTDHDQTIKPEGLRCLLMTCYKLSMDHYPEGPQTCLMIHRTLSAVVDACFNKKDVHSAGFVIRWLEEHCHRLIFPVHRYCVHMLATRYRDIEAHVSSSGDGAGLELATPVLEKNIAFGASRALMPVSVAWLLAGTLPPLYSRPQSGPPSVPSIGSGLASVQFLQRLVCVVPSHWVQLYDSREHGLGSNRFQHHVLAYRGPTLVLMQGGGQVFVVGAPEEWRESHLYWGGPDAVLLQVLPNFSIIERAPKMLYFNSTIRGYPKGLRAGADPRKPLLTVEDGFDKILYRGIPYPLDVVEVWGCGDPASRETQLDIKRWQVREAERQRHVKLSAADWMEHPDRYLLQLAGREQYNNTNE